MIITKDQQEKLIAQYTKKDRDTNEIIAFAEGLDAAFSLMNKILTENN